MGSTFATGDLAFISLGNKSILSSESDDALVSLIGGEKITWNIYFSGPFVAASIEPAYF
jgi:hypothetical protein